jgi:hypothetical protein
MAGYIGSKASVVSSGAERKKTFAITTSTTSLTGLSYTPTKVHVFHNGVRLVDGTDYTATNGTSITLTSAAENGDQVVVVSYATFQVADAYTQAEADAEFVQDPNGAITVSGSNVGIGTSSPDTALNIGFSGADQANSLRIEGSNGSSERYAFDIEVDGEYAKTNFKVGVGGGAPATRMTIDNSGNVGIGTSSPNGTLTVRNDNTNTEQLILGNSLNTGGRDWRLGRDNAASGDFVIKYSDATNSNVTTEAMRIDASGNLLVGAAAFSGSSNCLQIESNGELDIGTNTTAGRYKIKFFNPNGFVGNIATNGSATQYNTSSDYRLKTDAQPMIGASARVQALNPVNFEWIADGSRVDGFLAHEAQEVVPESVTGTKDAMRDEEYEVTPAVYEDIVIEAVLDDEGNELEAERTEQNLVTEAVMGTRSVPDYQGIDQSKLVPLLTAALQEALNKIDDMETRLAALEGN